MSILSTTGKVLATFGIYFRQSRHPTAQEQQSVEMLARTAAIAIERQQAEEAARLAALLEYRILDTAPEESFDALTRLAAHICGTPIALVTLVDASRQWFKSKTGVAIDETPREVAFCAHTITGGDLLIVPDAQADPRFAANPLVTADPFIRFYAGMPLITSEGHGLGTLCVIDYVSRELTLEQVQALRALARETMIQLELRRQNLKMETESKQAEEGAHRRTAQFETLLNEAPLGVYLIDEDFRTRQVNPTALPAFADIPDLIGRDFDEVMHILWPKARADEIVERFRHTLETGEPYIVPELIEERVDRGVTECYEWQINRIPLPDGRRGVVCYFRDISERVLAQQKIRESEERYRDLFNSIDEGYCIVEMIFDEHEQPVDYRFLEVNPSFDKQTGLHETTGKRMRELIPNHEAYWFEIYGKVALTGEPVRFTNEAKALNRWFDVYSFRLGGPESRKVAIVFTNITERKAAEEIIEQAHAAVGRSEHRYRRLFESARDGILILDNVDRKIADANPYMTELLGYTHAEFLGKELWEIGLMKDAQASFEAFQKLQANGYIRYEDLPLQTKNGKRREVEFVSNVYAEDNQQVIQCNIRDITERKVAEENIRQRDQLLQGIFDSVSSEIVVVDANGIITHVSHSWERFALENEALVEPIGIGMNYLEMCPRGVAEDPSAERALEGIHAVMEGKLPGFLLEYPYHSPTEQRWFKMQVDPRPREVGGAVITHTDITERVLAAERFAHEAFHDALTGLSNRSLFVEHLHQAIAHAERHEDYLFAVLFLDLDRFKFINDSLGHIVGDQFLVCIARKLESVVRPEDSIARIGGDEFTILLNDIGSIRDATRVASRINKEFSQPFALGEQQVFTTASVGITLSTHGYSSTEEILRDADTAMYRAKSRGGGRYEVFDPSMQASVMALLKLEADLRRAIEREEFCLHYQPIVSLEDNRITGFEALVRWRHPERGLVFPDEFIPVAEETGLIMPIGKWVLHEACRQVRKWQVSSRHNSSLSVSVNLSGKEFSQIGLIEQVSNVLDETGLSARSLKLEITESAVMDKSQATSAMLGQLKDLGVKLHIDDFGTGYSSLSNLHDFPVDVLKIDRSFVNRMGPGSKNSEIVQTIVQLAHTLGMKVTAEGVETAEQLSTLRAIGCEYAQGYHFSKPVDGEAAKRMIVH